MFSATLRKWFGVHSNYKDDLYESRVIRGMFLGRRYEITVGGKLNSWCTYYKADSKGSLIIRFAKLALWVATRKKKKDMEFMAEEGAATWGWNIMDDEFVLYLGNKPPKEGTCITMRSRSYYIPFPWAWRHHRTLTLDSNRFWVDTTKESLEKERERVWAQSFTYTTKHGEVQPAHATMTMSKRVSRLAWFKWLPWERTERFVHLKFNTDIGHDRSGWKGGVLGSHVVLNKRETPPQALERIVQEQRYG